MGEILGLGITHYPGLAFKGNLARRINMLLDDPALPENLRSPEGWPARMREQWADDEGNARMAWGTSTVNSWYKNAAGRVTQNWPFTLLEFWERTRQPDPADYELL